MVVSIEDIKKLRDQTGVSMSACKKALEESNGDLSAAVDVLRKRGEAKAADRSERSTAEGVVAIESGDGKASILQVFCETDFVARSEEYKKMAADFANKILTGELQAGATEADGLSDFSLQLGEKIQLGNSELVEGAVLGSYVHTNGKIGVVVSLDGGDSELARDVAMHIAATNPACISPDEVSDDLVAKEKEIWKEQLASEGKPAEIMDKIMIGKEKKFREDSALIKQQFVKDPEKTIEQLLGSVKVNKFVRYTI